MTTYYSTGLPDLDDTLGGGLPPGTISVLETPPGSAGILMAAAFAAVPERPTVYLTTDRTPDQIERDVQAAVTTHNPSLTGDGSGDLSHLLVTRFDDAVTTTDLAPDAEPAGPGTDTDSDSDTATGPGADTATPAGDGTDTPAGDDHDADGRDDHDARADRDDEHLPAVPDVVTDITRETAAEFAADADAGDNAAPYCLVFDALTALLDGSARTWTQTLQAIRTTVEDQGGVAMLVLPRVPGRNLSTAEPRVLHRADAVFRYHPSDAAGSDRLSVTRLSGAAQGCEDLPVNIQLDVGAALEKNPDETFS